MLTKRIEKAIQDKEVVILDTFDNEFIPLRLLQRVVGSIPTRLVNIMASLDYEPVFAGRKIKGWNVKAEQFYIVIGEDKPVAAFLDRHTEVHNFIYQTRSYLELWLPMLETNNRSYLTVAIGCTGGKHRSVYIAEQLADYFRSRGKNVQSRHRTLEKRKT